MKSQSKPKLPTSDKDVKVKRAPYQSPAIVYEGFITTRAGSPLNRGASDPSADPSEIFGTDD